jgi:MFS family permease
MLSAFNMKDPAPHIDQAAAQSRPESSRATALVLLGHVLASILCPGVWYGLSSMMAVLARKRFGAGDWQTVMITAAVPTLMITSIFWGDLLRRISIRRYLAVHWIATMAPLALAALAQDFWFLLVCHVAASAGASGWSPISGDMLRGFYTERVRGRAFGLINSAMFLCWMTVSFLIGRGLDRDENVFRVYLPVSAVAYGAGILILRRLVARTGVDDGRLAPASEAPLGLRRMLEPVLRTRTVLREDRTFFRYETAFMTYGIGWMICYALLPVLATDRLRMSYTEFAGSTQVVYPLCMLAMTYPMGWLTDRIGPVRTSGLSFAWLALYPVGLALSGSVATVGLSTIVYGTAMAGVHMGWMLGPVALAPSRERVAEYVAIHATMVGIRGIFAQVLGMAIYRLTDSFAWSFGVAALAFASSSLQMFRLHDAVKLARSAQAHGRRPPELQPITLEAETP